MNADPANITARTATRRWKWVIPVVLVGAVATSYYGLAASGNVRDVGSIGSLGRDGDAAAQVLGTSGAHVPAAIDGRDGEDVSPSMIQDVETITGAIDGHALIGRHVDLHVAVQQLTSPVAFWAGPRDNRVLVVMRSDKRTRREHQANSYSAHRLLVVRDGEQAAVSGTIQRVPQKPEDSRAWNLSDADRRELADRDIYIRADSVRPSGHGR